MENKLILLKVGGSILSPNAEELFSYESALKLKNALLPLVNEGYKFILSCGGGQICRKYQDLARQNGASERDQHWIGTEICNVNAVMMKIVLGDLSEDKAITGNLVTLATPLNFEKPFITVGAAEPGHSSDMDAILMSKRSDCKIIISLKNTEGVYSEDPKKNPNATKYDKLTWDEYKDIIKAKVHAPGGNYPVDPVATQEAQNLDITFKVLNGLDFPNLVKAIKGEEFVGTTIS